MIKTAMLLASIGGLATAGGAPKAKVPDCQEVASKWEAANAKEEYVPIGTQPLGESAFGMFMGNPKTRDVRALFLIMNPDDFHIEKGVRTVKSGKCQLNGGPVVQWKTLHKDPIKA